MCNGIMNCDDCIDEVYETCMQFDCGEGKRLSYVGFINKQSIILTQFLEPLLNKLASL